jgi:hypothetical protein
MIVPVRLDFIKSTRSHSFQNTRCSFLRYEAVVNCKFDLLELPAMLRLGEADYRVLKSVEDRLLQSNDPEYVRRLRFLTQPLICLYVSVNRRFLCLAHSSDDKRNNSAA